MFLDETSRFGMEAKVEHRYNRKHRTDHEDQVEREQITK